jgi:hypothetical protein
MVAESRFPAKTLSSPCQGGLHHLKGFTLRKLFVASFLAALVLAACSAHAPKAPESQSLSPSQSAAIQDAVKSFAQTVAHDVTHDGPTAWHRYLEDSPAFFMASNGFLVFPNSAAATAGINRFAATIKHIELTWGDDLRVDPLTPNLAVVAATYREVQDFTSGESVTETGFFTGTAEFLDGRWQFRNAQWSQVVPPRIRK